MIGTVLSVMGRCVLGAAGVLPATHAIVRLGQMMTLINKKQSQKNGKFLGQFLSFDWETSSM